MPRVLKVTCDSNWNLNIDSHIDESLNHMKNIMEKSTYRFVWLWVVNENIPPFSVIIKIVTKLVFLHKQLNESIDFNLVYCTNKDTLSVVNRVLSLYQPASVVKIARSKEEVLQLINANE